jgi:lipopolysaccharide transport system permease protein
MRNFSISPREMFISPWRNRDLIRSLIVREVVGRYQGSFMGIFWSLINPLLMLIVYSLVFSGIFKMRWGVSSGESHSDFAIILFAGLIVFGLFAECINRAPMLILTNVNYVKKVVFPLEVLPWVAFGSALFHAAVSVGVLFVAMAIIRGGIPATALVFPVVLLPLAFATIGFAWFLAALGVYLRDISQITGTVTTVLMFLSPVFYPLESVPKSWQPALKLNPLTFVIEESRNSLVFGKPMDVAYWSGMLAAGIAIAWLGFAWFQKSRRGFADVL